jgi:hypothetical protein
MHVFIKRGERREPLEGEGGAGGEGGGESRTGARSLKLHLSVPPLVPSLTGPQQGFWPNRCCFGFPCIQHRQRGGISLSSAYHASCYDACATLEG